MLALPTENTDICVLSFRSRTLSAKYSAVGSGRSSRQRNPSARPRENSMDLGIRNRRAIVTGGGSGIGYETARQFLEEGVRVAICGRNEGKLNIARDALANATG